MRNECLNKRDNDCDPAAKCIDTDESYLCVCPLGYLGLLFYLSGGSLKSYFSRPISRSCK